MRISDWSSDVCSFDLIVPAAVIGHRVDRDVGHEQAEHPGDGEDEAVPEPQQEAGGVGRDGGRHLLGAGGEACEEGKGEERLAHQWPLAVNSTPRAASTQIPTTNGTTSSGIACSRRVSVQAIRPANATTAAMPKRANRRASPNRPPT